MRAHAGWEVGPVQLSSRETESEAKTKKYKVSEGRERQGDTEGPRPLRATRDSHKMLTKLRLVGSAGRDGELSRR